jgi:hypothetical protein
MALQSHIDSVVKKYLTTEKKTIEEGFKKLESLKKKK